MKQTIIILVVTVLAIIGLYVLIFLSGDSVDVNNTNNRELIVTDNTPQTQEAEEEKAEGESEETKEPQNEKETIIGRSGEGNAITAYHYGTGETELLFVGGIHGGYSWNTALVAYELIDYLEANPDVVPENIKVTVIPVLNPDGLNTVVGTTGRFAQSAVPSSQAETIPGRFNANNVDLNRNFDCDWQSSGTWQERTVSGGSAAFSEPESRAIKEYVESNNLSAVVTWYSAAGGVYASNCRAGVLPETRTITNLYADASGYSAHEDFDFYEITGDMVNWLAKNNIPAISVLLTTHQDVEWEKNKKGIDALLNHYAQ